MLLNGSNGGMNEAKTALFAAHGFAALALGYFRVPGLSDYISNAPLEYFAQGLDWMRRTLCPAATSFPCAGNRAAANWRCWRGRRSPIACRR
jgi:hypothetical protein